MADPNLPEKLGDAEFYQPKPVGAERELGERLAAWRERRRRERKDEG